MIHLIRYRMGQRMDNNTLENDVLWEHVEWIFYHFTVWSDKPEITWFRKAFNALEKDGLCKYNDRYREIEVYLRCIALGMMYGDFCQLAWQEYSDHESMVNEVLEVFEGDCLRLGVMLNERALLLDGKDDEILCNVVIYLASDQRMKCYDAILKEYKDPTNLFCGLMISREEGNDQNMISDDVFEEYIGEDGCKSLYNEMQDAFQYVFHMIAIDS